MHVPKEVAALSAPGLKFRVALNAVGGDGAVTMQLSKTCPEVSSTFEPRDMTMLQPDHYEVKLDTTSGSGRASMEWTSSTPTIDVLVTVKEEMGSDGAKTLAVANPLTVDLNDIIERRKMRTLIIASSMGQVGISISVAPSDTAGYRRRLEAFLSTYNAPALAQVGKVVSGVSEIDSFTKVFKKYNIVDYSKRVKKFFSTYGPDHMKDADAMLQQWANREEELMRHLILDNGPELSDVDLKLRLTAFGKKYKLSPGAHDVPQLMQQHSSDPEALFDKLTAVHGPEPDPRAYLYSATYYGEKPPESPRRKSSTRRSTAPADDSHSLASNGQQMSSSFGPVVDEFDNRSQNGAKSESAASFAVAPSLREDQAATLRASATSTYNRGNKNNSNVTFHEPSAPTGMHNTLPSSHAIFQNHRDSRAGGIDALAAVDPFASTRSSSAAYRAAASTTPPPAQSAIASSYAPQQQQQQQSSNPVELWSSFLEDLRSASVPAAELHYLNEASFLTLVGELGYQGNTRQLLASEWRRRVEQSLRAEPLTQGDSLFEAAKRDVITISGLHPLNVTVVGVTLLKNTEHESSFSLRLGEAKLRTTERLMLVGEHHKLLGYASYGVSQQPQLQDASKPAVIFQRRPFAQLLRPTSVAVLVCDVVIGKPYIGSSSEGGTQQLTSPKDAVPSFLREFDTCVFMDPLAGQSVAVYHPTQVLPKYLVQCNVDTTVSPCPAHPSKPVEYFVVDNNVFACSQCVVMGQHRGKEVLTVEDATLQARSQLQDIQRDVLHVVSEMAAAEADCDRQMQSLPHSEMRMSANRQIEQIRREAEQRIAAIHLEVESNERARKDSIVDAKVQAKRVMDDAQNVATQLDEGLRFRGPNEVISLLMNTKHSGVMESIKDRASSVRHAHQDGPAPLSVAGGGGGAGPMRSASTNHTVFFLQSQQRTARTSGWARPTVSCWRWWGRRPDAVCVDQPHWSFRVRQSPQLKWRCRICLCRTCEDSFSGLNRTPRTAGGPSVAPAAALSSINRAGGSGGGQDASSLYSKFLSLKQQQLNGNNVTNAAPASSSFHNRTQQQPAEFASATKSAVKVTADLEAKRMKDLITSGWAEFRKGDKHSANKIWQDVYERNPHNATGARAKAYIAEAIEKNYQSASQWYEKALSYDPQDCLTLYNYGVLLESVLLMADSLERRI
ncbi:unnamed protein product [Bodo saltans]|uniref:Uncharacterized protein n=1 Tax=Bodo saltans TaxID=75058 RepID=A0A0S4J0G4_BODSA|nr:unnamed protein product [Bodo saltans]|eukprot:CUG35586.1 unnamed protein product [Bodo saltans]